MKNKFLITLILVLRLIVFPQDIYALPQLSDIEHGEADFVIDGNTLTVTVHTDQFIANYHNFNIAQNEIVRFIQPFATSTALNRVISGQATMITGVLTANGIIFIVNPAGINFGPTAQVNTAGLIASTLNINSADFLAQNYNFEGQGGYINVDQGALLTSPGGYIILLSSAIRNMGTIEADLGKVILATGEKITLDLDPSGDISVVINGALTAGVIGPDGEAMENSIENMGTIAADGGKIILTSEVLDGIFDNAINNTGIIEAATLIDNGGEIVLLAKGGSITNEGHIAADGTAEAPDGGVIDIEADNILHQGIISADAQEGGAAGDISIVAKDKLILDNGSLTSAAVSKPFSEGEGGNIYLNATEGDTLVRSEAVIDVSAGSEAGDAGFVEVSALEGLGFYGILKGSAAAGYTAARVLFDPKNITISNAGTDGTARDVFPGADEAFADHGNANLVISPASLAGMAFAEIFLQATKNITIDSAINVTTSIKFEAGRDINVNADIATNGGNITLTAKRHVTSAAASLINSGTGNITITADKGDLNIDGVVSSSGGLVNLTARDIDIDTTTGSVNGGTGDVTISPTGINRTIGLGTNSGNFQISNDEVNRIITTGEVTIGNADSGTISVGTINPANFTILNLVSGGDRVDTGAGTAIAIDTLNLTGNSIGAITPLNANVNTLNVTAAGNANIEEADGANFNNFDVTGSLDILAHASSQFGSVEADEAVMAEVTLGDFTINDSITSNAASVDITLGNGTIFANGGGPHVVASADSTISVKGGTITTTGTPLDVNIQGELFLNIPNAGVVNNSSAILTGNVTGGGGVPTLLNTSPNPQLPAGDVLYNGTTIFPTQPVPPTPTPGLGGGANDAINQLVDSIMREHEDIYDYTIENHLLSSVDRSQPVFYFYHPLTEVDYSTFNDIVLDAEAYEFVEELLELKTTPHYFYGLE